MWSCIDGPPGLWVALSAADGGSFHRQAVMTTCHLQLVVEGQHRGDLAALAKEVDGVEGTDVHGRDARRALQRLPFPPAGALHLR